MCCWVHSPVNGLKTFEGPITNSGKTRLKVSARTRAPRTSRETGAKSESSLRKPQNHCTFLFFLSVACGTVNSTDANRRPRWKLHVWLEDAMPTEVQTHGVFVVFGRPLTCHFGVFQANLNMYYKGQWEQMPNENRLGFTRPFSGGSGGGVKKSKSSKTHQLSEIDCNKSTTNVSTTHYAWGMPCQSPGPNYPASVSGRLLRCIASYSVDHSK